MNKRAENSDSFLNPILRRAPALALCLCLSFSAFADTTTLTVSSASKGSSSNPVTILFPVTRSGDLAYAAVLDYRTVDGSAHAGTDYSATSGSIIIPAGATSATIPVILSVNTNAGASVAFQLQANGATGIGPAPSFAARQTFTTGIYPVAVATADLNGDGKVDLVVANYHDNNVSVLFNTTAPGVASPTFAAQQTFATGNNPRSVNAVDINGDGKADLIVANEGDNTVSMLVNTNAPGAAIPSFAAQQTFVVSALSLGPFSVATSDVNGDGRADIIVASINAQAVEVLLNTTAPGATTLSFATAQSFAAGSNPHSMVAADVNGDGKPDLIVINDTDNTVSVLLNTTAPGAATPSFATQQTFATGPNPRSVTATDVNGDGKRDLIVANSGGTTVSVLLNTTTPGAATPSFTAQQTFSTGSNPSSVTAADVNGDGKPDLIVANAYDNTISLLLNITVPGAATPSFAAQQTFAAGTGPFPFSIFSVTTADVNGDGKLDVIVDNFNNNTVSVLLNTTASPTATSNFAAQQTFATGYGPQSVTAADVNGDGKFDLIVANLSENTFSVLLNTTASGTTTSSFADQQVFGAAGTGPYCVATADVNGDGKPDLIMADLSDNTVSVRLNTTAPGASTSSFNSFSYAAGTGPVAVTVADVNGDGKPDLIAANINSTSVSVLLNTTTPGAATPSFAAQQTFAPGMSPASVTVADVNGDGKADLIVANSSDSTVSVLLNTTAPGAAAPSFAIQQAFATGLAPQSVSAADVNGDGKPDLIVANYSSASTVSVLLNTTVPGATTPSFAAQQTFATGSNPLSVTVADVNGDGKPDLIAANFNDNTASVLLNTTAPGATAPSFATQQTFPMGTSPSSITVADINGDGKPDLIAANNNDNTVSVLLNTQYQTLFAGSPATGTIVHDYIFANGFE